MSKTYKKWSQTEIQFISDNQNMLDKDIAVKLSQITGQNITQSMVRRQRRKLGVSKKRGRPRKTISVAINNPVVTQ